MDTVSAAPKSSRHSPYGPRGTGYCAELGGSFTRGARNNMPAPQPVFALCQNNSNASREEWQTSISVPPLLVQFQPKVQC